MQLRLMIIVGILFFPLVSAGVFIEPLKEVYNYGDQLSVQTNLIPSAQASGHYIVDLQCGANVTINIFNQFFNLPANAQQSVTITTQLLSPLLNNITSACLLRGSFGGETATSNSFALSKIILVEGELAFDELAPGRSLSVSGTATKESDVPLNGFIELFAPSLNLYKSGTVANGVFNLSIALSAEAKSGKHNLTIEVYNTDPAGKKINAGSMAEIFRVTQILKDIEIVAENENVQPGTELVFRIDTRDQAGDLVAQDIKILIAEPKGLPFIKKVIKPGENQKVPFSLNNTPGYWSIEASVGDIKKRKLFYLSEVQEIQTSLINDTLIVTNIGNSRYKEPLEITIGSYVEIKQLNLDIGETQKFSLHAPDGTYSVSITDSGQPQSLGSTFLTGNAVRVTNLREDIISTVSNPIIWWLATILFVLLIVLVQIKLRLQRRPPTPGSNSMPLNLPIKKPFPEETMTAQKPITRFEGASSVSQSLSWKPSPNISSSYPTASRVMPITPRMSIAPGANPFASSHEGIRENAVVLAVRAEGGNSAYSSHTINSALSLAQETKAKIYIDGEYKIVLFSPRLTRSYDNETLAINAARRMEALFLEHNHLYKERLMFGLGIANGEIISEIENGKFHFTSTGNVISSAKRIAQSAAMKMLISDSVRRRVINTVKTERAGNSGFWEVTRVIDRASSNEFIRRFSKRNA